MVARAAPYFPKTLGTANGTNKDFDVGFPFLDATHLRVFANGVLKVLDTDYMVLNASQGSDKAIIRFATAPTDGHVIKAGRNTPINRYRGNPAVGMTDALQAQYRMQEALDDQVVKDLGSYGQTALLAGTALSWVATFDGFIEKLTTEVKKAVTTGGDITVEIDGVAVTGISIAVANSAIVGTVQTDVPTTAQSSTTQFKKGQTITVTPSAAFDTAGDVAVKLNLQPGDLS